VVVEEKELILVGVFSSGDGRGEGDNKKWSKIYGWTREGVRFNNLSNRVQKQCAQLAQGNT
jgi:hypothetical protein